VKLDEDIDPDEFLRDSADGGELENDIPEDGPREMNFGSRTDEDEHFGEMSDDLKDQ
jgi:hypothetical protein